MSFKEGMYLIWYSIRSFLTDIGELVVSIKKPKTWSYILLGSFAICLYYKKFDIALWLIPVFLLVKLIRDKQEGLYKKELFQKDLKAGKDTDIVKEYYEDYIKDCYYSRPRKIPLTIEEWKQKEKEKLN